MSYSTAQAGVIGGSDGKIYVFGGYSSTFGVPIPTSSTYDPRTNNWTSIANLPIGVRGPGIARDNSGLIYVMTGYSGSATITNNQVYNTTSNTWTTGTALLRAGWMPGATTGIDGRIYLAGGELGGSPTNRVQIYNPVTKVWSYGANMTTAREQFSLVSAPNGLIYAIGGTDLTRTALASVEAYNITANTWTAKSSLPNANDEFGATLGPDGLIYVFGGSNNYGNNNSPYYNTVYSYYWGTNTWYTLNQTLPTARKEVSAATSNFNNRMYVVGGANGAFLSTNEEATVQNGHPTTTTVSCTPGTVGVNNSTSCKATVTDNSIVNATTPSGTVTFASSGTGTFSGTCTLIGVLASASCTLNVTYTPTAVGTGSHIIFGTYQGDSSHNSGTGTFTLTVLGRTSSTSVNCAPSTVLTNYGSSCTVTVADTATGTPITPTGTVSFTRSGTSTGSFTPSASCNLSSGSCTVTFTPTSAGSSKITGSYGGDNVHYTSSGISGFVNSTLRTSSIAFTCHPTNNMINNYTSCTVTVTDTSSGPALTPSGTILLSSSRAGSFTSCTLSGSGAVATCSTNYTPTVTGSHVLTAYYGGNAAHSAASPNGTATIAVTYALRSVSATFSCTEPANFGVGTTCTVTVTDNSPGPVITPTGQVTMTSSDNGAFTGPCVLSGTGAVATCAVTYTPTGTTARNDIITINYPGDTNHTSKGATFLLTITPLTSPGGNTNQQTAAIPTLDWIILAVALAGIGAFASYFLVFKKKKRQRSFSPYSPPATTSSATNSPPPSGSISASPQIPGASVNPSSSVAPSGSGTSIGSTAPTGSGASGGSATPTDAGPPSPKPTG